MRHFKVKNAIYNSLQAVLLYLLRSLRNGRSINKSVDRNLENDLRISNTQTRLGDVAILITTFEKRFFNCTIPLITTLRTITNLPIFVMINGNYTKSYDNSQLKKFIFELSNFTNIYPTAFSNFHGLSELWNTGIVNADAECFLILNDDVHIYSELFLNDVELIEKLVLKYGLVTINRSFSHFGISRKCIEEVGFFDEHFLGIGEEDRDFFYRYELKYLAKPYNFSTDSIYHFADQTRDDSIRKNSNEKPVHEHKYSYFNSVIQQEFYKYEPNALIQGRYDYPVKRIKEFVEPRPLWKFRKLNYKKLIV